MNLQDVIQFVYSDGPTILQAILTVIGALKLIARYTPWEADDKALEKCEAPVRWVFEKFFSKSEEKK